MSAQNEVAVDLQQLGTDMIEAVRKAIAGRAVQKAVIEEELRRMAGALAHTGELLARGEINRKRAEEMVRIYRIALRGILHSAEGMTHLATGAALNAAMRAAGAVVNRITGIRLIETERKNA